jgi:hypothetical protein
LPTGVGGGGRVGGRRVAALVCTHTHTHMPPEEENTPAPAPNLTHRINAYPHILSYRGGGSGGGGGRPAHTHAHAHAHAHTPTLTLAEFTLHALAVDLHLGRLGGIVLEDDDESASTTCVPLRWSC